MGTVCLYLFSLFFPCKFVDAGSSFPLFAGAKKPVSLLLKSKNSRAQIYDTYCLFFGAGEKRDMESCPQEIYGSVSSWRMRQEFYIGGARTDKIQRHLKPCCLNISGYENAVVFVVRRTVPLNVFLSLRK